jgi:hypothetical protein
MVEMNRIRSLLEEKRQELADQLNAVDRAIAALNSAGTPVTETRPAEPDVRAELTVSAVLPKPVVEPRRVLSDAHKAAISAGKRRARAAKDAAKGLAREVPDDSFVPAIRTQGNRQSPRLVKRPIQK